MIIDNQSNTKKFKTIEDIQHSYTQPSNYRQDYLLESNIKKDPWKSNNKLFNIEKIISEKLKLNIKRIRVNSDNFESSIKNRKISTIVNKPVRNKSELIKQHNINFSSSNMIGDFTLDKTIGSGTFGKVKVGKHLPTGETVAIKVLEKSKIKSNEDLDRIKREMSILMNLKHENIIEVYDILEDSKCYYIIMENITGGELFSLIVEEKRLNEKLASLFFFQLINGLEEIHYNNIAHRDLKPENLIFTENKILKIIDFGLSNNCVDKQKLSTPCGSPCYASPEMILGDNYEGKIIDIWAVGVILYAMVCGYLPFEEKNHELLFKSICRCKLDYPEHISNSAKSMINQLLVTNPDKRIRIDEIKKQPFYKQGELEYNKINLTYSNILSEIQKKYSSYSNDMYLIELNKYNQDVVKQIMQERTKKYTLNLLENKLSTYLSTNKLKYDKEIKENSCSYKIILVKIMKNKYLIETLTINKIQELIIEKVLKQKKAKESLMHLYSNPKDTENEYINIKQTKEPQLNESIRVNFDKKKPSASEEESIIRYSKEKERKKSDKKINININLSNQIVNHINLKINKNDNNILKHFSNKNSVNYKKVNEKQNNQNAINFILSSFKQNNKQSNKQNNQTITTNKDYCITEVYKKEDKTKDIHSLSKEKAKNFKYLNTSTTTNKNITNFINKSKILNTMNNNKNIRVNSEPRDVRVSSVKKESTLKISNMIRKPIQKEFPSKKLTDFSLIAKQQNNKTVLLTSICSNTNKSILSNKNDILKMQLKSKKTDNDHNTKTKLKSKSIIDSIITSSYIKNNEMNRTLKTLQNKKLKDNSDLSLSKLKISNNISISQYLIKNSNSNTKPKSISNNFDKKK